MEDVKLKQSERNEPMPQSLQGFKNHPFYALERHCLKNQVIYPSNLLNNIRWKTCFDWCFCKSQQLYQKNQFVYPATNIKTLYSRRAWLYKGKQVLQDAIPIKQVKEKAKTLDRARELKTVEMNVEQGLDGIETGLVDLFGDWQVTQCEPLLIENEKIPRNEFGNIEVFHETMKPKGTVHVVQEGI